MFCHRIIIDSVIIYISSIQIDNGGRLKTKLYNKHDNFTFPIVNFSFISSNIPASPEFIFHNSNAIGRVHSYSDCLDSAERLTQKLLNQ